MAALILKRLATALMLLIIVSLLIFAGTEILPGDVAQVALGQFATPENVQALRLEMGLDRPAYIRYFEWLWGVIAHGDWGKSLTNKTPVSSMISERLANTGLLAGLTTVIAVPLAIVIGLAMAMRQGSLFDRAASVIILGLSATPEFLVGTLAVLLFAVKLGLLPAVAYLSAGSEIGQIMRALVLPAGTLVIVVTAQIARMTRAIIGDILTLPYIEMAVLKGVPRRRVVAYHALINAVGPIANVVALNVAYLVSGIVVVETIFAYPGLARLMIDAVQARDMPLIQACAMIFCGTYVILILLADIFARLSNPLGSDNRTMEAR